VISGYTLDAKRISFNLSRCASSRKRDGTVLAKRAPGSPEALISHVNSRQKYVVYPPDIDMGNRHMCHAAPSCQCLVLRSDGVTGRLIQPSRPWKPTAWDYWGS
jgi:hypothetical protein